MASASCCDVLVVHFRILEAKAVKVQVERFLVVHGQIVLNQFKNFPVPEVQRCAFVKTLKERMEDRRHAKLYLSKRKITVDIKASRKLNPMRNRAPAFKPKPMTATATNLVKAVWLDYFKGASGSGEGARAFTHLWVGLSAMRPLDWSGAVTTLECV